MPENQTGKRPAQPRARRAVSSVLTSLGFLITVPLRFLFAHPVLTLLSFAWKLTGPDLSHYISEAASAIQSKTPEYWTSAFTFLFFLRYTRLIINIWGSWRYKAAPLSRHPTWGRRDVTVILPTIDVDSPKFDECILSILENRPAAVLIVTVGAKMRAQSEAAARAYRREYPSTEIGVSAILHPSKRRQIAHAVAHVRTEFTVLADDHVFWPSRDFIPAALAPFEDVNVGIVATHKRVRRTTPGEWSISSIINLIGCLYLLRHNWELRASNAIDGGVFVVSGRTAVYRTRLLRSSGLMHRYCNEHFFFGLFGGKEGLGPDDDNFLTREAYRHGWDIKFQDTKDCTIETTLGDESAAKFRGQLVRWARTTFRSNPCMLRRVSDFSTWRMPFTYFAVYGAALFNFALLWDAALILSLARSTWSNGLFSVSVFKLVLWILWSKTIKLWPHILRYPADIPLLTCQLIFAYVHSFIKLWACITFYDCAWLGRNLNAVDAESKESKEYLDKGFDFGNVVDEPGLPRRTIYG
ncbi:family 2 glycosyltransferase [Colletotrichum navitas]|uniref:Family 2 glycosyltransferase n=1 Tax=Colletotrichum navitas TaxID=681940 RepID=A0AAD8PTA0_9PEZI|nr:family 2 glycosyltransferase [Colletotrichum navitas]KAK1580166.1 family 2 glycosyltransferase [Colletotrichum navitas]